MSAARLAGRISSLRYDPRRPDAFYAERSALALEVGTMMVPSSPTTLRIEAPDRRADERVRKLTALVGFYRDQLALRVRMMASLTPRTRRRRVLDDRQTDLFTSTLMTRVAA